MGGLWLFWRRSWRRMSKGDREEDSEIAEHALQI